MSTTIVNFRANVPHVTNMYSPRTGNQVANQFLITINTQPRNVQDIVSNETESKIYFQSYNTVIAVKDILTDEVVLDADSWDYSVTTLKYLKQFLFNDHAHLYSKKHIQARIDDSTYKLAKLN